MRQYHFFLLVIFFGNSVFAAENRLVLDHSKVPWSRLVYEASAFFITLQTDVTLRSIDKQGALSELVLNSESGLHYPKGENVYRIDTHAESFGKKTSYSLWFDADGEILQRRKLVRGKKNEIKYYRFSPCGYYTLREKFPDKKFDENYNQWKDSDKQFAEFNPDLCDGRAIYDVNTLLYMVSALNIGAAGYERELLVFSRDRLFNIKITAKKVTKVFADFKIKTAKGSTKIEEDVNVLKIQIEPVSGTRNKHEDFRFLGLNGKVTVYLDTARQLVVRLSGNVDVVGSIDVNLKKAELSR